MSSNPERQDVYERVTAHIITAIEAGAATNEMPWHHDGSEGITPVNALSRKPYRGVNVVALWVASQALGYPSGLFATYRQWAQLGAQVRKGERGHLVVFWKVYDRDAEREGNTESASGEQDPRRYFARGFTVFNAAQVDGFTTEDLGQRPLPERVAHADRFYESLGITTRHRGTSAYYLPASDMVTLPPFESFPDGVAYYATALHEAGHATAAPHRLGRDLSGRFGSELYAAEELIAELSASFVCADLGLAAEPRADHAVYIASWLKVLHNDKRAIFTAASKAQAAADWMHAQQPCAAMPERRAA